MDMCKKKILVLGMVPPPVGGMAIYMRDMLDSNLKEKYNLVHFDTSKKTSENRPLIVGLGYQLFLILKLIWALIIKRPHLVHIHICSHLSFFRSSIDFAIAKLFLRKVILHIHGASFIDFYRNSSKIKKVILRTILRKSNKIIVLSSHWKRFFQEVVDKEQIKIVPNGVSISRFQHSDYAKLKEKRKQPTKIFTILFLGALGKRKGIYDIVKAMPLILEKNDKFLLKIVGPEEDSGVRTEIKAMCNQNNLTKNVNILSPVDGVEKYNLLSESDVFILPSYAENFPIAMIEAMAAGLPLIMSNIKAISEIIQDGVNGFLVEPGNYEGIAKKILFLMQNREIGFQMGKRNFNLAREKYDFKMVVQKLDGIYSNLITI